ncbi:hypothetical protein Q1695_015081 [Nippostrongylus brasiliensis]|nr:hypothetical protein Q1695_015081 [Nippostrongylus brasiliensis]
METTMLSERWHLRLKNEILHRNANSRADCLVGLLVRAVDELAESNEIKDSRRLATASFQVQQTAIKYRSTVAYLAKNPEAVLRIDTKQWKVADVSPGKTFSVATKGGSDCAPARNVHCPVCRVCPYSWTCTCLDNRTGITCMHRHAVTVNEGPTPSTTVGEPQEALAACDVESGTATADLKAVVWAQERLQSRMIIRNKIEIVWTFLGPLNVLEIQKYNIPGKRCCDG